MELGVSRNPELKVGASRDVTHEVKTAEDFVLANGILDDNTVRWTLEENEKLGKSKDGVRYQTFLLFIDAPLPVKARIRLVCVYVKRKIEEEYSRPGGNNNFLELVFNV